MAVLRRKGQDECIPEPAQKRKSPDREAHDKLVERGTRWVRSRCTIVAPELRTLCGECPDVYGYGYQCSSIVVECKASRADFLRDAKKEFRIEPEKGLGERRYYMCPPGMIRPDELPDMWGLLYCHHRRIEVVRNALPQPFSIKKERWVLASILRRTIESNGIKEIYI